YDANNFSDYTHYRLPCGLSAPQAADPRGLTARASAAAGTRGGGPAGVIQPADGRNRPLQANTVAATTTHSLVPLAARAAGLDFQQLVLAILADSLEARD